MKQRGAAMLAVLWATVILSFMALALAGSVRTEVAATANLVESERGYFLARAGIEAAILYLTTPQAEPEKEFGRRRLEFEFETGSAVVDLRPSAAQLDLNQAPPETLQRLFVELGVAEDAAAQLAQAIDERRRPPLGRAFESLDELLLVRGMTTELLYGGFRRSPLRDLLAIRGASLAVNPNYAELALLAALPGMERSAARDLVAQRDRAPIRRLPDATIARYLTLSTSGIFTLVAHGRGKGAALDRAVRAVVELDATRPLGYRIWEWNDRP